MIISTSSDAYVAICLNHSLEDAEALKGAYVLIIQLDTDISLRIRSLGNLVFAPGTLIYVGSAMGTGSTNLENRIRRHFRKEKTIHWHIDHLLDNASLLNAAVWAESGTRVECRLAQKIAGSIYFTPSVRGFGASDCKNRCYSHLFHYVGDVDVNDILLGIFRDLNLIPQLTKDGNLTST